MEKCRQKTMIAELSDHLLRIVLCCFIGIGWFVALWGLTGPALTAGFSLGIMFWMGVRQFAKKVTQEREKLMREIIGGELALERLLMEEPKKAAFQCTLWLESMYPLVMIQTFDWGVIGRLNGKRTMIKLIAQHPSQTVCVQQVVECAREARRRQIEHTLLCLTAAADKEASLYAAGLDPPLSIIERPELIKLAGRVNPATNEDLIRLSRRKQKRRSIKEWLAVILDISRARRYLWYGIGLSLFAMLIGNSYYVLPASICLALYAGCKIKVGLNDRRRWTI